MAELERVELADDFDDLARRLGAESLDDLPATQIDRQIVRLCDEIRELERRRDTLLGKTLRSVLRTVSTANTVLKACAHCGVMFTYKEYPSTKKPRVYCSRGCSSASQRKGV